MCRLAPGAQIDTGNTSAFQREISELRRGGAFFSAAYGWEAGEERKRKNRETRAGTVELTS